MWTDECSLTQTHMYLRARKQILLYRKKPNFISLVNTTQQTIANKKYLSAEFRFCILLTDTLRLESFAYVTGYNKLSIEEVILSFSML